MEYLFKVVIALDEQKVRSDGEYRLEDIYSMIRKWFADEQMTEIPADGELVFVSDNEKDFGLIGLIANDLCDAEWFRPYATKFLWYDRTDGAEDCEDVLKEYEIFCRKYGK